MLCSSCSENIRPIAVFDIDGTLGDYHGQLISFAKLYTGHDAGMGERPYDGTMNFGDWMQEAFHIASRKEYRDLKLAFRQGGTKRWMPPYQDMINAVAYAATLGCEIWLATTRPYLRLDSVDPDTREWLARNEVPFDHLMYDEHKYDVLFKCVDPERVIIIVDDLVEQLSEATATWNSNDFKSPVVLRDCPYNEGVRWDGPVVATGEDLENLIAERVERWNDKYGEQSERTVGRERNAASGQGYGSKRPTGGWASHREGN